MIPFTFAMTKKIALAVLLSFTLLTLVFFSSIYFLLRNKDFQHQIIDKVEKQFQNQLTLTSFDVSFFPPISLIAHEVTLKAANKDGAVSLKAPSVKVHFRLWPLFFRRIKVGYLHAKNSSGYLLWKATPQSPQKKLVLSGYDVEIREVSLEHPMDFSIRGRFLSSEENLQSRGRLTLHQKDQEIQLKSCEAEIHLKDVDFSEFVPLAFLQSNLVVKQGSFSCDGKISWVPDQITLKGTGSLKQLMYALPSTSEKVSSPADFDFRFEGTSHPVTQQFHLHDLELKSPYGDFLVKARFGAGFETPPLDLEIKSGNINFDRLPEFLVPLDKVIPNKFGFSGQMQMSLFLRGRGNALSITGTSDMTSSLLSYASYFTKPKELPLKLQFDLTLKDRRNLQGDFNLWLKEMSLKGSVLDLDLTSGSGEITFLTNKFSLAGWESILQVLNQYPMQGWAKILLNAKGVFTKPESLRYSATVTLDDAQAVYEGLSIRDLDAILEFTNRRGSSGRLDFLAQDSPIHLEYIRHISPYESLSIKILSPEWYPLSVLLPLKSLAAKSKRLEVQQAVEKLENRLAKILTSKQPLKNVSLSASRMGTMVSVQDISFNLYDGSLRGSGEIEWNPSAPNYHFGLQIDKLPLKPFFEQITGKAPLEGSFYLSGDFEGDQWGGENPLERLRGRGEFKVIGGSIPSFDLLAEIAKASRLLSSSPFSQGITEFNDLASSFVIQNGKVITDQVTVVSPRFTALANGFFTLEGILNYHVLVTLTDLVSKQGESTSNKSPVGIPLQIYGDFENPKVGLDPSSITQTVGQLITDRLLKKKNQAVPGKSSALSSEPAVKKSLKDAGLALLNEFLSEKGKSSQ